MDLNVYIQLMFLSVVNIIFTFSGIISNTLVIMSFWKSSQLQKKLCHFMIVVLSFFDLVTVVTIYPGILLYLISWLREDYDLLLKMRIYLHNFEGILGVSFLALLVMNIERYLGTYYPIFHRTFVTKRRLLTLLAILLIPTTVIYIISRNGFVIQDTEYLMIFFALYFLPFIFVNFKLFIIARKVHRERAVLPGRRTRINLKNVSTGLWAVACLTLSFIPNSFYIAFSLAEKSISTVRLSFIWALTSVTINSTLNSLIFFWKNKVLRTEGMNILRTLKHRLVGS